MQKGSQSVRRVLFAACVATAFLAAGCGSSAYTRRRDKDALLSARVGQELAATPALTGARVEARSHWGVVALLGEVADETIRSEAGRVAGAIPGVARVDNLILVVKEGGPSAAGSTPAKGALILARTE
jgi:osmotically-inducible protein OsmY